MLSPQVLAGLMLLSAAGAFCLGFALARYFVPIRPTDRGGVRISHEDLLEDLELDLAREENDLTAALADLAPAGGPTPGSDARLAHLRRASKFSEQRLAREHQRLVRLAESSPGASGIADEIGRHRERVGELRTVLEGDPAGRAVAAVRGAISEFAEHNRRLSSELDDVRGRLAARETELLEARREARVDPLTKIANRRSFEERLAEHQTRLERGHDGYAVVLFDLDCFKSLNDRFGHPAGDAALTVFAKILKDTVRSYDLAARYGGEEFAVLLPGAKLVDAGIVADRCRKRAEQAIVRHGGDQITFTVSGGIAAGRGDRPADETVARADEALYSAKLAGRNRVLTEEAATAVDPSNPADGSRPSPG